MRAKQQRMADVGRARRAGDEIHGAGHQAFAIARAQPLPDRLIIAGNVLGLDDNDMSVRQKIERRRIVLAGGQDQRAGFGDTAEGMAEADEIAGDRAAVADVESGDSKGTAAR